MSSTVRSTMAQALVRFLSVQYTERDGTRQPFFGGMFGIFGHGNVAGVGQALDQMRRGLRYYQCRNEQAMVHTAAAYAKMHNRMRALACTTSIGPGATNMLTGAAGATINRVPVLLLPGDIFASRLPAPVLQQLESSHSQDISVNDCFKPVSKYWDRINRPEQILSALPEAMRILADPAETGAVTIAMPEDVQAESYDYPGQFFEKRVYVVEDETGAIVGSAYVTPNYGGPAAHVANAGFMVDPDHARRGIGRLLADHVLTAAKAHGFRAMVFNAVVETNPAVGLWKSLGFSILGTVPEAFDHPRHGRVGLHIMHKAL